jgi:hypothetical protein
MGRAVPMERRGRAKEKAMAVVNPERMAQRLRLVEEHLRAAGARDLPALLATFGPAPVVQVNAQPLVGPNAVGLFYAGLLELAPALRVEVRTRHVAGDAVVAEVVLHAGALALPVCGLFHFGADEKLAEVRLYLDPAALAPPVRAAA